MGTHANIFVETGPNIFVGTYCHYDGYPDHMLPSLNEVSNDDLRGYILVAGLSGGMRFFNPPEEIETLAGHCRDEVLYLHNPVLNEESAHFIYIKQMDGVVRWRKAYSNNWQHEKLSILPLEECAYVLNMKVGDLVTVIEEGLQPLVGSLGIIIRMECRAATYGGPANYYYVAMTATPSTFSFRENHLEVVNESR